MKKYKILLYILAVILITAVSITLAFYNEDNYTSWIRNLYISLSGNKIYFIRPEIYIHFPGNLFVFGFALFNVILFSLIKPMSNNFRLMNISIGILLSLIFTITYSYIDSSSLLETCANSAEGRKGINYSDINYDLIWNISLFLALLPSMISTIIRIRNKKTKNL